MTTPEQPVERWSSWQTLDSGRLLLLAAAGMLVVAALASTIATGFRPHTTGVAVAFGLFIAFGELLRLALPGGREAAPIAMAGAMSYALLMSVGGQGSGPPVIRPLQVIAVAAVGMTVGALPHIAAGRPAGLTGMATRLVAVACVAFVFRPLEPHAFIRKDWPVALAVMIVLVLFGWLVDTVIGALIR